MLFVAVNEENVPFFQWDITSVNDPFAGALKDVVQLFVSVRV